MYCISKRLLNYIKKYDFLFWKSILWSLSFSRRLTRRSHHRVWRLDAYPVLPVQRSPDVGIGRGRGWPNGVFRSYGHIWRYMTLILFSSVLQWSCPLLFFLLRTSRSGIEPQPPACEAIALLRWNIIIRHVNSIAFF